jgi:hypothetical protein
MSGDNGFTVGVKRANSSGPSGHPPAPLANVLEEGGRKALGLALESVDACHGGTHWRRTRQDWDVSALSRLRHELAELDGLSESASGQQLAARAWARRTVNDALLALQTSELLRHRHDLDSERLRTALAALPGPWLSPPPRCRSVAEAVESVAFGYYPATDDDCGQQMAQFVLLLLAPTTGQPAEACQCPDDLDAHDERERFESWAAYIDWTRVNNAAQTAARLVLARDRGKHMRFVVSLHGSPTGQWPEELEAWLRLDGDVAWHGFFHCLKADQKGTQDALSEAVAWADREARRRGMSFLRNVDIAAPATLLLDWRPEEQVVVGGSKLGLHHDVVTHSSDRLNRAEVQRWVLFDQPARRWAQIGSATSGAPVDWLAKEDTTLPALRKSLQDGRLMRAVGLDHRPRARAMKLLFTYIPVVLWPGTRAGFPAARHACLDDAWGYLPEGFSRAYRDRLQETADTDLADLRAIWDDSDWLDFCEKVAPTDT